jgi:hypothetical protein
MICSVAKYQGDQIKEDEMGETCTLHEGGAKCMQTLV